MKNLKDLNRWSVICVMLIVTLILSRCWKPLSFEDKALQGGDIQKAIDTEQYK